MDLLQISRTIWRHRLVTLPIVVLTLLGAFYVVAFKASVYSASSSFVLINPPLPPTAEDIARDPALGRVDSNNPYTRFPDQSVIVGLLSSSLSNESARQALSGQGADRRYTVAPASQFASSSLLVDVTGMASTPQEAMQSAELVGAALTGELDRMQASQGVDPRYRIKAQRVVAPDHAEQRLSGMLRPLVGVLAMGAILLFVVISAAEALATLRAERSEKDVPKKEREGDSIEGPDTNNSPVVQQPQRRLGGWRAGSKA